METQRKRKREWRGLIGNVVEVHLDGQVYRRGLVDDVMPDSSGLWIALDANSPREYLDAASGFEVWV